jgi:Tetratricopeptide repeat
MADNEKTPPKSSPDSTPDTSPDQHPKSDGGDSILDFGVTASVREGASGVIPLADLPDPGSSPSLVSWTEVIRQHRETQQAPGTEKPADDVKIDSTSDKDLLARLVQEEQQAPPISTEPAERDTDKLGSVPLVSDDAGSSVQLGLGFHDALPEPHSGSAVQFDLRGMPSDAIGGRPSIWSDAIVPEALPVEDADLVDADIPMAEPVPFQPSEDELSFVAELEGAGTSGSAINFAGGARDDEMLELPSDHGPAAGQSSILDILVHEEKLEEAGSNRAASDVVDVTAKPRSDIISDIDSGKKRAKPKSEKMKDPVKPPSAFDLDSLPDEAVDLYAEGPVNRSITESGSLQVTDEEMEEASRKQQLVESSAIDLSSNPSSSMFEVELANASAMDDGSGMSLLESQRSGGSSVQRDEIDEETRSSRPARGRKKGDGTLPAKPRDSEVVNQSPSADLPSPRKLDRSARGGKTDAAGKKGGMLVGALLGFLLAVVGVGAAWYFKALPDRDSVTGDGAAKNDNKGSQGAGNTNDADLAKAKKDADDAKTAADAAKKKADDMVAGMSKQLKAAGIDEANPEVGLKKAIADRAAAENRASNATDALAAAEVDIKIIRQKIQPKNNEKLSDAVLALIVAKEKAEIDQKTAESAVAAIGKQLKDAGIDDPKPEDGIKKAITAKTTAESKVKEVLAALDKAGAKDPDVAKAIAMLVAARDNGDATAKGIRERLEKAKIVAANADQVALFKAIDDAITRGSSDAIDKLAAEKKAAEDRATKLGDDLAKAKKDSDAAISKAKDDLVAQKTLYEAKLTDVRTPAQLIDVWLPALADKDKPANNAAAIADAEFVMKNAASTAADKAKALAVKALALRNQGKLVEARAAFDESRKHPGFSKDQAWAKAVGSAADILENPAAFVGATQPSTTPTQQQLLERVEGGLKLFDGEKFAKDRARLIAQRSLLKLEAADTTGALADADEAVKAGAGADGNFALARVLEAQGKFADAEAAYRAVLKAQAESSPLYKQASLGLARVLLQKGKPAAVTPATTSMFDKDTFRNHLALMLVLLADPEGPIPPDVQEALALADALIAQKEYHGYVIKADALAKIGRFNSALTAYATGIKQLKVLPKEYDGVLDRILARHPALQQAEGSITSDPSQSLKHYGQGLEFFRARDYARAEEQFVAAISNSNKDARYLYYLGLSRWIMGKKEVAAADFKAGALLELKGLPLPKVISDAFEPVQGSSRAVVEAARP